MSFLQRFSFMFWFCLISLVVGAGMIYGGIETHLAESEFSAAAVKTTGIITDIDQYLNSDGDRFIHEVTVSYEVGGEAYEGVSNDWSSHMYVGQSIAIYYNQNNPGDIQFKLSSGLGPILFLVGFGFVLMAAVLGIADFNDVLSSLVMGGTVFLVLGVFLLGSGLMVLKRDHDFKQNGVQTESNIIDIIEYEKPDGDTSHDVIVAFTVDGIEYRGNISLYSGDMYVGQPVTVYYNIDNPWDFRQSSSLLRIVLLSVGGLFLLIGLSPFILSLLKYISLRRFEKSYDVSGNYMHKEEALRNACSALNKSGQPWEVIVKGNKIEARYKWKVISASPLHMRNQEKQFAFSVTLSDAGRWWEDLDDIQTSSGLIGYREFFAGISYHRSWVFDFKKDKVSGKRSLKKELDIDTTSIKRAVREYLRSCGYKRARILGR